MSGVPPATPPPAPPSPAAALQQVPPPPAAALQQVPPPPPVAVVKPLQPIMAILVESSKGVWTVRSGGVPHEDWTGLIAPSWVQSPFQLRPTYIGEAQKAYKHRVTGLKEKFVEDGDITYFADEFERHLRTTGMDTIAYLKDPETSEMVSVVSKHTRFTVATVTSRAQKQSRRYDDNDWDNDHAATECLLDSVSPELKKRIRNRIQDNDTFPKVWIEFITLSQSTSIDRYEQMKKRIQGRHPSQYAGQDLVKLVEDFSMDAKNLTTAGQYDHSLTLRMLQTFLKAGGDGNTGEAFRFPLRTLKIKLDSALLVIGLKEKAAAHAYMTREGLLYSDVCTIVENEYRKLKDAMEWSPAKHAQDSKAAPSTFGANVAQVAKVANLTDIQIMALMQSGFASGSKSGTCNHCKKPGHWKRECPELKTQQASGRSRGPPRFKGRGNAAPEPKGWRTTPPAAGAETVPKHVAGNPEAIPLVCQVQAVVDNS